MNQGGKTASDVVPGVVRDRNLTNRTITQRACRRPEPAFRDAKITSRGFQFRMTEQNLNDPQISVGIKQVCGRRVAQHMRTDVFFDPDLLTEALKDPPNHRGCSSPVGKQSIDWLSPAPENLPLPSRT